MLNPPITGIQELDAYLYDLHLNGAGNTSGVVTYAVSPTTGDPVPYQYQYIHIRYADDNVGTGMSDSPTYKLYWGIHNSATSTESTNPADYTWYATAFGFGTNIFVYFLVTGGRYIKYFVDTAPPTYQWTKDGGSAIDLDILVQAGTIGTNEIHNAAITAVKTNIAALDQATGGLKPLTVSADTIMDDAVTSLKILNGSVTNTKLFADAVTADKIAANSVGVNQLAAGAVTAVKIDVGQLSAISANMGSITAGDLKLGTADISGTSMVGVGSHLYSDGRAVIGTPSSGINFDGTKVTVNGDLIATGNIQSNAVSNVYVGEQYVSVALGGTPVYICQINFTPPPGTTWDGYVQFSGMVGRDAYTTGQVGITATIQGYFTGIGWQNMSSYVNQSFAPTSNYASSSISLAQRLGYTNVGNTITAIRVSLIGVSLVSCAGNGNMVLTIFKK